MYKDTILNARTGGDGTGTGRDVHSKNTPFGGIRRHGTKFTAQYRFEGKHYTKYGTIPFCHAWLASEHARLNDVRPPPQSLNQFLEGRNKH